METRMKARLAMINLSCRSTGASAHPSLKVHIRHRLYTIKLKVLWILKKILTFVGLESVLMHRVVEVQKSKDSIGGVHDYRVVQPPAKIKIVDPYHREFLQHSLHYRSCEYQRREAFVCSIDSALYDPATGVVATKDNTLVVESAMELGRLKSTESYKSFVPTPKSVTGTYATIWHMWGYNYYHWLLDCLPRFYSLKSTHDPASFKLLMPERMVGFQEQSLAAYISPETEVLRVPADRWLKVDRMLLPSFVTHKACGDLPEAHSNDIRETIFSYCGLESVNRLERNIYISRRKTKRRQVLNEPEILELLATCGFESYVLEDMSFYEQVRLFHSANAVVAMHGAGLANILFSGRIKVLDINPSCEPNTHFFFLAHSLKQDYHYILSEGNSINDNVTVDVNRVKTFAQKMLDARVYSMT
jgi:Glycosyltransferase 61